jgi:hypothetical protein
MIKIMLESFVTGDCTHFLEMSAYYLNSSRETYRSDILETWW